MLIRVERETLSTWRRRNQGPPSFKRGKRILYRRSELEAWLRAKEASTRRGEELSA